MGWEQFSEGSGSILEEMALEDPDRSTRHRRDHVGGAVAVAVDARLAAMALDLMMLQLALE